ncbi:hypothetical protein X975_14615, partial [Stegodyphus mimosarum]
MSSQERMNDRIRWRIAGRFEVAQSQAQVATKLNVTSSVVCSLWKQFQETGSISRRPGQSGPRSTT